MGNKNGIYISRFDVGNGDTASVRFLEGFKNVYIRDLCTIYYIYIRDTMNCLYFLNVIFGMCNIGVILRRNEIYLYSKKPNLDQLFHCQSFRI